LAGLRRSAWQNAVDGRNVSLVRHIAFISHGWHQRRKLSAFGADLVGQPAVELATGCGVHRHRCANDRFGALGSLLRCVNGNDHNSGERSGRSRATDWIEWKGAQCELCYREKTPANAIRSMHCESSSDRGSAVRRQQGRALPPVRPISIPGGPRRRQSEHADLLRGR
jgi:hypothetical protein